MDNWQVAENDPADIERLVRGAGGFVGASIDLRPRVLEAARDVKSERASNAFLRRIMFFLACSGLIAIELTAGPRLRPSAGAEAISRFGDGNAVFPACAMPSEEIDWRVIENLLKLRHRQAQLIRDEI